MSVSVGIIMGSQSDWPTMKAAAETVAALRGCCRGVHLMALGWEDLVPMVVKRMGER